MKTKRGNGNIELGKSKDLKISNSTNKQSKNSDRVMTLDKLKKFTEHQDKLEYSKKYMTLFLEHGEDMERLLSFKRDLEELACLKEVFIKTKFTNGVKIWGQLMSENRYKDKLQEIQSKSDELAQKNSNDNNAIFRTNNNGFLQNGHLNSGKNYNLITEICEQYDITIIKD